MGKISISKTLYWRTETGKVITIEDLPANVRQQVEIFDAIRADLTDIKYQEQVYSLALATKKNQIEQIMEAMINVQEQQDSTSQTPNSPSE